MNNHPSTCFNFGPDGAPWTELMPIEMNLWIGEGVGDHRRVLHSVYLSAKSRDGAARTAKFALSIFLSGRRYGVTARRATAYDYRDIIREIKRRQA